MIKNIKPFSLTKGLFLISLIFSLNFYGLFAEEKSVAEEDVAKSVETEQSQKSESINEKFQVESVQDKKSVDSESNVEKTESSKNTENEEPDASEIKSEIEKTETKKTKSPSTITILSAQKTEYSKSEIGADVIILTGDVKIKVEQGGIGSIIYADRVSYERKRQRLFAEGNVTLDRLSGSTVTETMTASSVLFNAETQEGVFSEGRVSQTNSDMFKLDSNSSLVVDSDIFGRDNSGVIGFKNGSLTFCDSEEPHWKIDASRIWLLPGNEFAFVNARFFVGSLLTLWLPFFYYPKDEMIFNPVIGTDDRKGYFVHTSTYLVGRKPLDSSSGGDDDYFSFLKPTKLKKQVREGLFLHNLEEDASGVGSNYLKFMADYYTKLGGFVGIDGVFKPKKVVSDLTFSAMLGFSNTLYRNLGSYTPYNPENNYQITNDKGYLLGLELPFRFYANLKTSLSYSPFSLSLSVPIYSDSYFKSDFLTERSETMDWFSLLTSGLTDDDSSTTSTSGITSYSWTASASFSPNISFLNPVVTSLSLSNIKSSIAFSSKNNESLTGLDATYNPNRKFFYPSQIVPVGASLNISGTIFSYPFKEKSEKKVEIKDRKESSISKTTLSKISEPEELNPVVEDKSFENSIESTENSQKDQVETIVELSEEEKKHNKELENQIIPTISTNAYKNSSTASFVNYSLTYSITPTYDSLITYNSNKTTSPNEISFSDENFQSTYYKVAIPTQLSSSLSLFKNLLSLKNTLKFSPQLQEHPFISQEYYSTEDSRNQIILNDYAANTMDVVNTNSLSLKPFPNSSLFNSSSISWNSTIQVIDTEFIGTVSEPEWEYKKTKWNEDGIKVHNLNLNLALNGTNSHTQSLSFTSNLPPRLDTYTAKYKFSLPFMNFSIETGIAEIDSDTNNDGLIDDDVKEGTHLKSFEFNPLKQSLSLNLFDKKLSISQSFNYNIEEQHPTSLSFSASIWGMSLSFSMNHAIPYKLDINKGWVAQKEKEFLPNAINFSYNLSSKTFRFWKNRISLSPGLSTSVKIDMIRPTNSSFVFSPSITFNINEFLNLTFKATSRNDVIFRYFQDFLNYDVEIPGEKNIIKDLIDSFDFANQSNREKSGFKLKSFSIILTHDLHDWDFKSEFSIEPKLVTDEIPYRYDFSPYFSISVMWKPMNMFKTQIEDEDGKITLNP